MDWISILKCPISKSDLRLLTEEELATINTKAQQGVLWQADGKPMPTTIDSGIINVTGSYIYPIVKGIVLLLPDLALVD